MSVIVSTARCCKWLFLQVVGLAVVVPSLVFAHEGEIHGDTIDKRSAEGALSPHANVGGQSLVARNAIEVPASQGGSWSEPEPWPVLAVHANLLPNGRVLAWDATPDDFDEDPHTTQNFTTRVTVWDPESNQHLAANNDTDTDLFCAGSAQLWDGRVLFAGGDSERAGRNGPLSNSNLYDPWTNTWKRTDNMMAARWYSSVAALPNGEMLTLGGSYSPQPLGEVFQLDQRWRALDLLPPYSLSGDYQWLQAGPDGEVLYFGPHDLISTVHTAGSGRWEVNTVRDGMGYRGYGSYAMYDIGRILIAGGGDSTRSAVVVNAQSKQTTGTGSMNVGRRQHNLTILADGSVMASGGNSSGSDLVDLHTGVLTPEIWNPDTGEWRLLNPMQIDRQYHSVAILLPDATVLSAGGGYCGLCTQLAYHEQNAEIFSPPYLFDENSGPARRPLIVSAPDAMDYGEPFSIELDSSMPINKAHLIKLGSVTHSENQEQRLVPLPISQSGNTLTTVAPAHRNFAPPGYYMLFVLSGGVPSVAKIVRLGQPLLQSGQLVRNTIASGQIHHYVYEPESSDASVSIVLGGLQGNLDLLLKLNAAPTEAEPDSSFVCVSRASGATSELCQFQLDSTDKIYIAVQAQQSSVYQLLLNSSDGGGQTQDLPFNDNDLNLDSAHTPLSEQLIPTTPSNVRGEVYSESSAEIFWDASIDNEVVQFYEVYRDGVLQLQLDARSWYQTDLQPATEYRYRVAAVDNDGNRSAFSAAVSLTTPGLPSLASALPVADNPNTAAPAPAPDPDPALAPEPVFGPDPVSNPVAPPPAESPIVFRLMDADSDKVIALHDNIQTGDSINQSLLPSAQLSVEARVSGIANISRVSFDFDGNIGFRSEFVAPYALFGDYAGDFIGMPFTLGAHVVTATVYVGDMAVATRSVSFTMAL